VRDLGIYSEVRPSDTPASELQGRRGIIISGGPASVYDPDSPRIDPQILNSALNGAAPVLGICYGQQLMSQLLGGEVRKGTKGEYGLAVLDLPLSSGLFANWQDRQQVWMSHRDLVSQPPAGFSVLASTPTCPIAAIGDPARKLYGVQFHPEVVHTTQGTQLLSNFLFDICGCTKDWDPRHRIPCIEEQIRATVGDRNVFFFVSGGVDSTVAFTLCLRALGPARVRGVYVDTGLMRTGEIDFVRKMFKDLGSDTVSIEIAEQQFLHALHNIREPEEKRHVIGEQFVLVQERIIESRHLLDGHWILGQGTIYPDTIESGGTAKAAVIKTHHNRVAGIQKLLESNRLVEPLSAFYKDEVREIGRELGLAAEFLDRHPFPGPGLAIRCLCSTGNGHLEPNEHGYIVPILSVGVQGDSRSYAPILATADLHAEASELVNANAGINRVIARVDSSIPLSEMRVYVSDLSRERLDRLREADAIVRDLSHSSGFDTKVWQFPVVLIPLGSQSKPDSIVLRPIDSVDGMTAQSVPMPEALLREMSKRLLSVSGVAGVFYDLTHKPPATIEWE
jgi:GMP synthase (glutamine-hydrolysing)